MQLEGNSITPALQRTLGTVLGLLAQPACLQ